MNIGILRETKVPTDTRVPLTPGQCRIIEEKYPDVKIYVQPSPFRCFTDQAYLKEGITISEDLGKCDVLLGVKEVTPSTLLPQKTYLFFSHTVKKQNHNRNLLKALLDKHIRLIDFELLTDNSGARIIGFGRWAGIIGAYLGLGAWCIRTGLPPFTMPSEAGSLTEMLRFARLYKLPQVNIVITGDGRVAGGACELLDAFRVRKLPADEYLKGTFKGPVYTRLSAGEYNRHRNGSPFVLQHFFKNPSEYASNFSKFQYKSDMLIAAAYWDPDAPRLFSIADTTESDFRIRVIADISCDINGSVPTTIRTTSFTNPYFDYNPFTGEAGPPFTNQRNITVMAIDNLPCGLPVESSADFGQYVSGIILPLLLTGDPGGILEKATLTRNGMLTQPFKYLHEWAMQSE